MIPIQAKEEVEIFFNAAVATLDANRQIREQIREQAKIEYGDLLDAYILATGVMSMSLLRNDGNPGHTSDSISRRWALIAAFVQGMDICETAVTEALYFQAATLIRQELEIIAAIEEVTKGTRKDGKNPNVRHLRWELRTQYGYLSAATHVADSKLLDRILKLEPVNNIAPVSLAPVYHRTESRYLYGIHVAVTIQLAFAIDDLFQDAYGEGLSEMERRNIAYAVMRLVNEGTLLDPDEILS